MDPRWQFIVGDLLSNIVVALAACLLTHAITGPAWPMVPAMVAGMAIGMTVAFVLATGMLMRWFGAMEIMLPTMVAGMVAGMATAMYQTMAATRLIDHLLLATIIGILTTVLVWVVNSRLVGEQHRAPATEE